MCIIKTPVFFLFLYIFTFYIFLRDKDCLMWDLETHAIFILYLNVSICCILISYNILSVYIHPHTTLCIMALQTVILWFLCFYTTHMQCQLCWWIMQRKVYLKEMNDNYYQLLFTLKYILKVCFWFWGALQFNMTKYLCCH